MLHPLVSLGYPVPKLALYPMVILLLGLGWESRTAQVALECFFPLFIQCYAGAKAVGPRMEWLARNVDASPWIMAKDVILPSALPFLFTGLRVAIPIMLIVTTVTEFIGDSHGLGYLIARSSAYFDTASAFAVVAVLGVFGLIGDRLVVMSRDRFVFWEKGTSL
jgi:NitT/TauT family transport system permease protein